MTTAIDGSAAPPGRTRISMRALTALVTEVAADAVGVKRNDVSVAFRDEHRLLAITITTTMRSASLASIRHDPSLVDRTGGTLLARAANAEAAIAIRVAHLTELEISRVTLIVTGVRAQTRRLE